MQWEIGEKFSGGPHRRGGGWGEDVVLSYSNGYLALQAPPWPSPIYRRTPSVQFPYVRLGVVQDWITGSTRL